MLLELTAGSQRYVEDCENCCNPIIISYEVEEERVSEFNAEPAAG